MAGRKSKYDEAKERFHEIQDWLRLGATDREIAENLGISNATMCDWKNKHTEFSDLIKKGRKRPVQEIKAALFKRATGFTYSETKTVIEYEEWDKDVLDQLQACGIDTEALGKRRLVRTEIYEKQALPDPASAMILLKHWDKETEWTNDPARLKLAKEELELKKKHMEEGEIIWQ